MSKKSSEMQNLDIPREENRLAEHALGVDTECLFCLEHDLAEFHGPTKEIRISIPTLTTDLTFECDCAVVSHVHCMQTWLQHDRRCPICKAPSSRDAAATNHRREGDDATIMRRYKQITLTIVWLASAMYISYLYIFI
jgi:hypothetical protein